MSKKKNEELEDNDNINKDFEGDIREADDTFGLPEIEYEPLSEETAPEEEAPAPVERDEPVYASDEPEDMEPEPTDPFTEETEQNEEDSPYMYASHADDSESNDIYQTTTEEHYGDSVTGDQELFDSENVFADQENQAQAYIPGSYTPKHQSSNKTGIIIAVIIVVLLLGGAAYYFFAYKPEQDQLARQRQEQRDADAATRRREQEAQAQAQREAAQRAEEERLAREAEEAANATPEIGTIETISARTGRYYVVVASAIDGDLAMDYANKLIKDGYSVKIIAPFGKSMFHRVAVKDLDTWANAESAANELKADYGDGVWVIKY